VIIVYDNQDNIRMQFSEENEKYHDIPEWAKFLIMFGVSWTQIQYNKRRIAIISMPCDSAAAGLVTLGAMIRFLERPEANDFSQHLQRIRNEKNRILIYRKYPNWTFRYDGSDGGYDMIMQIKKSGNKCSRPPLRTIFHFKDVCFQGEPFIEDLIENELPYSTIYSALVSNNLNILEDNLRKTDSSACLAGRVMGERKTRDSLSKIHFTCGAMTASLDQLITVHNWSQENISRVSFFNTRIKKIDRYTAPPRLVVTDGDSAFLTVLDDKKLFGQSDIIAVIDRTLERDRLETITEKLQSISQWYVREDNQPGNVPLPIGMSLAIWKAR